MADDGPQPPIALTFAGVAGEARPDTEPTVLPAAAGAALRAFFDAHPAVAALGFELALDEAGDALEYAGGTLHALGGAPLRPGRDAERAGAAFRRLLRAERTLAELPTRLAVALGGIDHAFRIAREATGAGPVEPVPGGDVAGDRAGDRAGAPRAAARERARLRAQDERWDQRDPLPDDD